MAVSPAIDSRRAGVVARQLHGDSVLADRSRWIDAARQLVRAGKLDEAEAAARNLLARFPDEHDGWARLGMVHEARGENDQAAECYRNVIDFLRHKPDYADPDMVEHYAKRIAKLDPPAT